MTSTLILILELEALTISCENQLIFTESKSIFYNIRLLLFWLPILKLKSDIIID